MNIRDAELFICLDFWIVRPMLSLPRELIIDIVNLIGEDTSALSAIFAQLTTRRKNNGRCVVIEKMDDSANLGS